MLSIKWIHDENTGVKIYIAENQAQQIVASWHYNHICRNSGQSRWDVALFSTFSSQKFVGISIYCPRNSDVSFFIVTSFQSNPGRPQGIPPPPPNPTHFFHVDRVAWGELIRCAPSLSQNRTYGPRIRLLSILSSFWGGCCSYSAHIEEP